MPADKLVNFHIVERAIDDNIVMPEDHWGRRTAAVMLHEPGYGEYEWLSMGDEVVQRLHLATGEYLAKKALNAS